MELPITDIASVLSLIPQRSPIVMVDALWEYTPTTGVTGLSVMADNLFVQQGRFLESGLIEHIAQSIALHKGYYHYLQQKHISIYRLPIVGEALRTELKIIQEFMDVTLVAIQTFSNNTLIAEGEMKTVLASTP